MIIEITVFQISCLCTVCVAVGVIEVCFTSFCHWVRLIIEEM